MCLQRPQPDETISINWTSKVRFCPAKGADTKEDIPPKCFFQEDQRQNLIKISAHIKCNQEWDDAIEYFRNLPCGLSPSIPVAQHLFATKVARSLKRNQHLQQKMISELRRKVDIYSPGGIYLRSQPGVQVDSTFLDKFVSHIVRGLYYHHKGEILPESADIVWKIQPLGEAPEWITILPIIEIHPEIFRYRYAILEDHPEWSTWIVGFYDLSIGTILAVTGNEQKIQN